MAASITSEQLAEYLGLVLDELDVSDRMVLDGTVGAVNVLVVTTVPRVRALPDGAEWPADVQWGAVMQGARIFTRRRSPGSVSAYSDTTGQATYVARWDPDIERLMLTGKWFPPQVG